MSNINRLLSKFKKKKIALYGLGVETEKTLVELGDTFEIIGLLDSFKESGELYGKPIISLEDVVKKKVGLILVVARPGSAKAIAKRIGNFCKLNHVALIDVRGNDLLIEKKVVYDFENIISIKKKELLQKIKRVDVVSFDFFDTLAMRCTLESTDVVELVDVKLQEQNINIQNFCNKRLESEKNLSRKFAPTLIEIYQDMLDKYRIQAISAEQLAELEWEIDYELVIARHEMCDIFRNAHLSGKEVYVVSDTYYTKAQIAQLLEKCGITEYTDIIVSCEYRTSKTQGLFKILLEKTNGRKCLHIGDDLVADVENASKNKIETFRIYSGLELMESLGYLGLQGVIKSVSDRIKIGMFIAYIFNSPFQFENDDKKISIKSAYSLGYLCFAPMVSDFVIWFYYQIREEEIKNIWLGARDGYLIKKMFKLLNNKDESVYFMTSRMAAIRASIETEEDVKYVDGMRFSGTVEECLKQRFGIILNEKNGKENLRCEQNLIQYKELIFEKARKDKKNYLRYIDTLNVKNGDIAFFDFVAKGTCQMYVQRLVSNQLRGYYFLQLEPENMKDKKLDIVSYYSTEEKDSSAIFDDYYILETILTAPHPSVNGFDEMGKPIYAEETRKKQDIFCFQSVQDGILDYFATYLRLCPVSQRSENKKLGETLLALIHKVRIEDDNFLNLVVEDPFFNRMTSITDVL